MKRKELKNLAEKIAKCEKIIQTSTDTKEKANDGKNSSSINQYY